MRKYLTAAGGILLSAALVFFLLFYKSPYNSEITENKTVFRKNNQNLQSTELIFSFPKGTLKLKGMLKEGVFPYIDNPTVTITLKNLLLKGKAKRAIIIYSNRVNIVYFNGKICDTFPISIKKIYFIEGNTVFKNAKITIGKNQSIKIQKINHKKVESLCLFIHEIKHHYATIKRAKSPED